VISLVLYVYEHHDLHKIRHQVYHLSASKGQSSTEHQPFMMGAYQITLPCWQPTASRADAALKIRPYLELSAGRTGAVQTHSVPGRLGRWCGSMCDRRVRLQHYRRIRKAEGLTIHVNLRTLQ
jgi:hypothetical protein